jgi:hypothetical protein
VILTATVFAVWLLFSVISYGMMFAYCQRHFPTIADEWYREDMSMSIWCACFGPIGFISVIIANYVDSGGNPFRYGLKFK